VFSTPARGSSPFEEVTHSAPPSTAAASDAGHLLNKTTPASWCCLVYGCGDEQNNLRRIQNVTDYSSFFEQITDEERDKFF
jgi:hypothetical protein